MSSLLDLKDELQQFMDDYQLTTKTSAKDFAAGSAFQVRTEHLMAKLQEVGDVLRGSVSRLEAMGQFFLKAKDNPALRYEAIDKALSIAKDRDLYQCLFAGLGTIQKAESK